MPTVPLEADEGDDEAPVASGPVLLIVGWREWIGLPSLNVKRVKAKVDTGARTSALHAINIHYVNVRGRVHVRFDVHPKQKDSKQLVRCEAPLIEERYITDSGGKRTLRPVIETVFIIAGVEVLAELTLITRDAMGFRMLIGRQALRQRFVVSPGASYLGNKGPKKKKRTIKAAKAAKV